MWLIRCMIRSSIWIVSLSSPTLAERIVTVDCLPVDGTSFKRRRHFLSNKHLLTKRPRNWHDELLLLCIIIIIIIIIVIIIIIIIIIIMN